MLRRVDLIRPGDRLKLRWQVNQLFYTVVVKYRCGDYVQISYEDGTEDSKFLSQEIWDFENGMDPSRLSSIRSGEENQRGGGADFGVEVPVGTQEVKYKFLKDVPPRKRPRGRSQLPLRTQREVHETRRTLEGPVKGTHSKSAEKSVVSMPHNEQFRLPTRAECQDMAEAIMPGDRIGVYWPDDGKFYYGTICSLQEGGVAHVTYDDGDEEVLTLAEEIFKKLKSSTTEKIR